MLKKTLSWVMVGMLFLSLIFRKFIYRKIDHDKSYRKYNEKCIKTSAPYSSNYFMSEQMER